MKTCLYSRHLALGAKIVDFSGWEMPLQYEGVLAEHRAVRENVALFDVSHMGRIKVAGPDAERLLDYISTNRITGKKRGTATYTVWCNLHGGCIDDVIIYKVDEEHFFVIVNASNRDKDLQHLITQAEREKCEVKIEEQFSGTGIIALQGPAALSLLSPLFSQADSLQPMHFLTLGNGLVISRTGYTGAGGFEFYGSAKQIEKLWDRLIEKGVTPAGLGARDTLRLEMGFALYGHELSETIFPSETVSAWTIKWEKPRFLGKEPLEKIEKSSTMRHAYGIRLLEKGIPRQGCKIFKEGMAIGEATSGSFSPTLGVGIALILVDIPLNRGDQVAIQIRQTLCRAEVGDLPFVRKTG